MSIRMSLLAAGIATVFATGGWAALANPNDEMRADARIYNGLFALAVADQIRRNCPSISARMFRAMSFMHGLRSYANGLGFTDDEITAFIEDRAEKDLMRGHVLRYFSAHGVVHSQPETYCALGRAEIAAGNQVGVLLWAN